MGQDLDHDGDGVFRIARRVAKDRVISTVDPDARHGHKTSARGFDGYKGHLALDPDSEIVTATEVSAANAGDAEPATDLLADELPEVTDARAGAGDDGGDDPNSGAGGGAGAPESPAPSGDGPAVYGDSGYGTGPLLARLETAGAQIFTKVQPPNAPGGRFAKGRFIIDLTTGAVTCPGRVSAPIRPAKGGGGIAVFGTTCAGCPLATQCTTSPGGRTITISAYEQQLARARAAQADPAWVAEYKATRPKVERKIGHLMPAATVGVAPECAASAKSPPTSPCWPPRSTWPASVRSDCTKPPAKAGKSRRHDSKNTAAQQIPHRSR